MERQAYAELCRMEIERTIAMLPTDPEGTIELLSKQAKRYRQEIMPWLLTEQKKSTEKRREQKRVFSKVDLRDEKSVLSFYNYVTSSVRKRKEKFNRENK